MITFTLVNYFTVVNEWGTSHFEDEVQGDPFKMSHPTKFDE